MMPESTCGSSRTFTVLSSKRMSMLRSSNRHSSSSHHRSSERVAHGPTEERAVALFLMPRGIGVVDLLDDALGRIQSKTRVAFARSRLRMCSRPFAWMVRALQTFDSTLAFGANTSQWKTTPDHSRPHDTNGTTNVLGES